MSKGPNIKTLELKKPETDSTKMKCNDCDLKFKTESGLKVHIELVHSTQFCREGVLECDYCLISCSDFDFIKKHMEREHKYRCHK